MQGRDALLGRRRLDGEHLQGRGNEGPYGVGVRTLHLTKPSAVDPSQERVLDTVVWYPAAPGSSPISLQEKGVIDAPLLALGTAPPDTVLEVKK